MVRVGERDFYAVTTSTEWAPYFPIFHSRDLVSWSQCGAVFSSRPTWASGQFWAPEISYRDGTFFVYYSARRRNGPLTIAVATASRPEGPWTDGGPLLGQANGSIDATTATENGRPWLLWKEDGNATRRPTTLWAAPLADDGKRLAGEPHALLVNDAEWEGEVIEAPSLLVRDGWHYLFYSGNTCCGEDCRYAVGVARARRLTGPWEKCPRNPILAENRAFRGPGHGSVTTTADGRTYYLYHAYANRDGATTVGRELMLDEVGWANDGWPEINGGRGPSTRARAPFGWHATTLPGPFVADFGAPLDASWQWPQHHQLAATVDLQARVLQLRTPEGRKTGPLAALVAQPARSLDYTATAVVDARGLDRRVLASLAAYGNGSNALGIGVREARIVAWVRRDGAWSERDLGATAGRFVHLRIDAIWGKAYRVAYSGDGRRWEERTDVLDGSHLPPWDRGVRIALCAGGAAGKVATFRELRIVDVSGTLRHLRPVPERRLASVRRAHR